MDSVRGLEKFYNDLSFAIDTVHKSIVWIECFDFGYIKRLLDNLSSKSNQSYNIRYWSNSTGEIKNTSGDQRVKVKVNRKNEKDLTVVTSVETVVSFSEALKWFINTPKCTHLVLRASENNFFEKEAVPTLQEFVCLNKESILETRRTIIIVAATHIEVPGLEHICERFTLPLADVKDIDKLFGLIPDEKLVTERDRSSVTLDKDTILEYDELELPDEVVINDGRIKDDSLGLIRRENGKVKRIVLPRKPIYEFSSDFIGEEKDIELEFHYQKLVDSLSGMYLYDIIELLESIKADDKDKQICYFYEKRKGYKNCELPDVIKQKKKQIVENSGLLEVIDISSNHYEKVADIEALKNYINKQKSRIDSVSTYPPKFPKPKGILLVGAPGCGKSESAKAIASMLDLPLYRLNIGNLLGHKYEQSENKFTEALRTADASAPCVLWIDEIEKAFAGAGNEAENDDTLTHIVGHFLTWMQEHKTMVYLVATANDLSRMKPEMLRRGRWDERFILTYPTDKGCEKILYAILKKKFEITLTNEGKDVFKDVVVKYDEEEKYRDSIVEKTTVADQKKIVVIYDNESKSLYKKIAKNLSELHMSGAEIENCIIDYYIEISDSDFGDKPMSHNNTYKEIDLKAFAEYTDSIVKEKCQKKNCDNIEGSDDDEILKILDKDTFMSMYDKEMGYFLCTKVYSEILDRKINKLDMDKKEIELLIKLLFVKYNDLFNFKSAC